MTEASAAMDQQEALRALDLSADATPAEAEAAYRALCTRLQAESDADALQEAQRRQLEAQIERLTAAIECLRRPRTSVEQAGAAMLASVARARLQAEAAAAEAEPARPNGARAPGSVLPSRETSAPDPHLPVRPAPQATEAEGPLPVHPAPATVEARSAGAGVWLGRMLGLLAIAALAVFAHNKWWDAIVGPAPAPGSPVPQSAPETAPDEAVRTAWQTGQERVQRLLAELERAASLPPEAITAAEWRTLVATHVADNEFLGGLRRAAARPVPTAGETAAQGQLAELEGVLEEGESRVSLLADLREAVLHRAEVVSRIEELQEAGLPDWPLAPDRVVDWFPEELLPRFADAESRVQAAAGAFAAGDFAAASHQYREAASLLSTLQVQPSVNMENREQQIQQLYLKGWQAISRYQLSRPEEGSALSYARQIEALEPGRGEAEDLMDGVRRAYISLVYAELVRGDGRLARHYAGLAKQLGADDEEIQRAYRAYESTRD